MASFPLWISKTAARSGRRRSHHRIGGRFSMRVRKCLGVTVSIFIFTMLVWANVALAQLPQQGPMTGTGALGLARQGASVSLSADGTTALVGGPFDASNTGAAWVFTRNGTNWAQQGSKLVGTVAARNAQQGFSVSLSADGTTALVGGPFDNSGAGAVWVFARSGTNWAQQGPKLVGALAVGNAQQGHSVSLSADGNTALVGGPADASGAGAAWVFTRSDGVWAQQGPKLVGALAAGNAQQGTSVSLSADGNTAIVGGPGDNARVGAVWVFTRSGGVWTPQGPKLVGALAVGAAQQGTSASLSADGITAIVGGPGDTSGAGAVWVFTRSGTNWAPQGPKLVGALAAGNAQQGTSVSLSADGITAIVGGPGDASGAGAVWVFTRSGVGVWSPQGPKRVGTGAVGNAQQGTSVSLSVDGSTAIAGGPLDASGFSGAAWVLTRSVGVWAQQGKLIGTGTVGFSQQGASVSLSTDGTTAIVGGPFDAAGMGAVWVFARNGGVWAQQGKLVGTGTVGNAQQGHSVSLSADGTTALVGGPGDAAGAGAAWVFTLSGGVWTQQGSKLVGGGSVGPAQQGTSVSLSADGNTAIVGGPGDNSRVGAAWVFTRNGGVWTPQGPKLVGGGSAGSAQQGTSVSLSAAGNTALVGGPFDATGAGAVWVFTRSGVGVWSPQGGKLVGGGSVGNAQQGHSVSLSADGNTALVGGPFDAATAGAVWVFTRSGVGVWTPQGGKLVGTGAVGAAQQGASVSLSADGSTALVGGPFDALNAGAAWVFTRNGGVWTPQGGKLVGTGAVGAAQQGASVSLSPDGSTAIVGGPGDASGAGAVWVFTRSGGAGTAGKQASRP